MLRDDPDEYHHVYGGNCRPAVLGSIYFREVAALKGTGRLCNLTYDPMLKVHVVCDLGFNDFMSLLLVQRLSSEIRIIRYIEDRLRDIPSYSEELRALNYNWGTFYLPHDGKAKTLAAASNPNGATAQDQFNNLGWTTQIVDDIGIEQGIRKTREVFPRFYVSREHASDLVSRWGRYRRRVNSDGQGSTPIHDDASHGNDGTRYLAIVADQMSNDTANPADILKEFNRAFRRA
jgi:phage terminase large subunit